VQDLITGEAGNHRVATILGSLRTVVVIAISIPTSMIVVFVVSLLGRSPTLLVWQRWFRCGYGGGQRDCGIENILPICSRVKLDCKQQLTAPKKLRVAY